MRRAPGLSAMASSVLFLRENGPERRRHNNYFDNDEVHDAPARVISNIASIWQPYIGIKGMASWYIIVLHQCGHSIKRRDGARREEACVSVYRARA